MKRLYFLCPTLSQATDLVRDFRAEGLDQSNIHVAGKDHHLIEEAHLHEASDVETTRLRHGLDAGMVAGGSLGLLAGVVAVITGPFGLAIGGGTLVTLSLIGMGFGGWFGSMIGERLPDTDMHRYEEAIERGELLIMADLPQERIPSFYQIIKQHHPEAEVQSFQLIYDHELAA